ncbi:MAG: 4-(cytidine 5'-diphospho)-2-C-methyl-D-erythritol kinase [Paraprevotella sp.]|nr:4-(cytidine 5'-diphospho)-2-C-methyl-D-erythritol kinase [Paraprevotella sp.]
MITLPNAKINLGLNITEKRPDGYHNLETIFYPIPLQDAIEVRLRDNDETDPKADDALLPPTENKIITDDYTLQIAGTPLEGNADSNLVIKAFRLVKDEFNLPPLSIHMFKHIPSGAGLGGGSADAAFMLKLLNDKFNLGMTNDDMEQRIAPLGADCAFFVRNTPVFATGIGNIFTPIQCSLSGWHLVLVKPDTFVSTKEAYAKIRPQKPATPLTEIINQPIEEWRYLMINDFEESIFPEHPEIAAIKDKLYDMGATYASMSGSGSSVFGLFKESVNQVEDIFSGHFCRQRFLP